MTEVTMNEVTPAIMDETTTYQSLSIETDNKSQDIHTIQNHEDAHSVKYKVFIVCVYVFAELLIIAILCASIVLSIIFGILSGDYSAASFIGWFIFAFTIISFLIYCLFLICKKHRSPNNFKKFTVCRCILFGIEFLLILFTFQIIASMIVPNSTIFSNLYSTDISLQSVQYNQSVHSAKALFDCHLKFDNIYLRDISQSPLNKESDGGAYVIGDTIHTVFWTLPTDVFVHECVHIWQFRHGYFEGIDGLNRIIDWFPPQPQDYDYGNLTQHRLNGMRFSDFNIEQQAEIIAHYFLYLTDDYSYNVEPEDLKYYATQTILTECSSSTSI